MRDPNRIDLVLDAIREVWIEHPDLRLGQLVVNAVQPSEPNAETFAIEDFQLINKLGRLRQKLSGAESEPIFDSCSIDSLNEILGPDYRITDFDGWGLTVDLAVTGYPDSWHTRIKFEGVTFLDCPTEFSHAQFRLATTAERELIAAKSPIEDEDQIIAITAETMAGMDVKTFFVVCESVSVTKNAV